MNEHAIQNAIRNALAGRASVFRVNVVKGWQGRPEQRSDGSLVLHDPRPVSSGLPVGFSDLVGWRTVTVTDAMVGQDVAVFTAIEVKTTKGRTTPEQERFLASVRSSGGLAGVARCESDALAIVEQTTRPTVGPQSMDPKRFEQAIAALGWTPKEAATELGVTERTIANYRTGATRIPRATERLLAMLTEGATKPNG